MKERGFLRKGGIKQKRVNFYLVLGNVSGGLVVSPVALG